MPIIANANGVRRRTQGDGDLPYLPQPPTDAEKYSYLRKPRRWIFAWIFVSAVGIMYGYVMVAVKAPWTTPALLFLPIMVLPVVVNFWLRAHKPRLTLAQHRDVVSRYRPEPADTVDIWVPTCGEPLVVLRNTCRAVSAIRWHAPVMRYLLDDGERRPEVEQLALEYGFVYVRRREPVPGVPPREGERGWLKKAGNLINAFDLSMGRFGVVFDADFAPRHDFLYETVPYLQADRTIGIVQTAQYFDIEPWMNYVQRGAGSLQEIFFRWIQPARDVWRAAICAGTNVAYRRAAVESVGGFARVPLGEDVNSGVKLWTRGWETRYLPLVLAKGVAPDSWEGITNQQQRWCRSSMLLMTEPHFRDARFNWQQRSAFWAAFLYYMASAGLLVTAPFPTLTMLWFFPDRVLPHNYLPMVPALLATLLVFPMMARGWRPEIFRLCLINSACHVIAIWDALRAKVQEWVPTGAAGKVRTATGEGGRAKKDARTAGGAPRRVSRLLRTWIVLVQALLWGGLATRLPEYGFGPLWTTAVLAAVQLYMVMPLLAPSYGIRHARPPRPASPPAPVASVAAAHRQAQVAARAPCHTAGRSTIRTHPPRTTGSRRDTATAPSDTGPGARPRRAIRCPTPRTRRCHTPRRDRHGDSEPRPGTALRFGGDRGGRADPVGLVQRGQPRGVAVHGAKPVRGATGELATRGAGRRHGPGTVRRRASVRGDDA